jgi:L-amino acid N-acyltransferase
MTSTIDSTVRRAAVADRVDMLTIYNSSIQRREIARHDRTLTLDELSHELPIEDDRFRAYVATIDDIVFGWAALRPWHQRVAYAATLELLVYVAPSHRRRGLGRALVSHVLDVAVRAECHSLIVLCPADDAAAVGMARATGFSRFGTLRGVLPDPGRARDVEMYQRMLQAEAVR